MIAYFKNKHEDEGIIIASGIDILIDGLEEGYIVISDDLNMARENNDFSNIDKLSEFLELIDKFSNYLKVCSEDLLKNR